MSIAQAISELLGDYKIEGKLKESRINSAWYEILGPLAKSTDELYIKDGILFAKLSSSVIRSELYMMRSTLVQRLNEKAGAEIIRDIVFR